MKRLAADMVMGCVQKRYHSGQKRYVTSPRLFSDSLAAGDIAVAMSVLWYSRNSSE